MGAAETNNSTANAPQGASTQTSAVIIPPTKATLQVCDALDAAIGAFLKYRNQLRAGEYEADVEAILQFNLGIRHVESVTALARNDLVLAPGAYAVARCALECCARAAWLVDEEIPIQRERRYFAHLGGEIETLGKLHKELGLDTYKEQIEALTKFKTHVESLLVARGVPLMKQVPNFRSVLESIGIPNMYATYIEASQYTHGSHKATWLYRKAGLGTLKEFRSPLASSIGFCL